MKASLHTKTHQSQQGADNGFGIGKNNFKIITLVLLYGIKMQWEVTLVTTQASGHIYQEMLI